MRLHFGQLLGGKLATFYYNVWSFCLPAKKLSNFFSSYHLLILCGGRRFRANCFPCRSRKRKQFLTRALVSSLSLSLSLSLYQSAPTESTHHSGKDHCTAGLQFNKSGLDERTKICCFCMYLVKQLIPNF